jgi:hypothetical protein
MCGLVSTVYKRCANQLKSSTNGVKTTIKLEFIGILGGQICEGSEYSNGTSFAVSLKHGLLYRSLSKISACFGIVCRGGR